MCIYIYIQIVEETELCHSTPFSLGLLPPGSSSPTFTAISSLSNRRPAVISISLRTKKTMMTKKKKIVVFSIFTLSFAAAAAILDIFSQTSFWKKTTKKKVIQLLKEEENPNPEGRGGGSTSTPLGPPPDRISELPVEILHRILGFLDMDQFLIQTSLVSNQWRNLWKSVSTLNFSHGTRISGSSSVDNGGGGVKNNVEKYQNFVDHVLRLRDSEASKIQIFRYCCDDINSRRREGGGYDYLERLHNFIFSAVVNQGAQEIHIWFSYLDESSVNHNNNNRIIHFNPSIFTSSAGRLLLRKFTFAVFTIDFLIQFPRSICCATQLTHLGLAGIILPKGDDDAAQLHLVFPLLQKLYISNCYSVHLKVLDISAPRLNSLSICNCSLRRPHFDGLGGCRLEIRTPNLTSFNYSGSAYVDCFVENLPRIANARLDFDMLTGTMEETTLFAIKLLKRLTSAQTLILGGFEVFLEDLLKELLTPFTSLRTLMLLTSCKISSIHGMVHFLNSCSSVEKLIWMWKEICTVESDEHLMLPQCRLPHLKHVRIVRLHGHQNEIEFVKFLLKNSVVLEDIFIQTTADSPKQLIEENLKQFIKEEPSLRRSIKLKIFQEES